MPDSSVRGDAEWNAKRATDTLCPFYHLLAGCHYQQHAYWTLALWNCSVSCHAVEVAHFHWWTECSLSIPVLISHFCIVPVTSVSACIVVMRNYWLSLGPHRRQKGDSSDLQVLWCSLHGNFCELPLLQSACIWNSASVFRIHWHVLSVEHQNYNSNVETSRFAQRPGTHWIQSGLSHIQFSAVSSTILHLRPVHSSVKQL